MAGIAAAFAAGVGAHPANACFRHTFEPCAAATSSDYVVEVDRKTGRTWIKDRPADAEEMAALAASASKRLAMRSAAVKPQGEWKTQVSAGANPTPRSN